MGALDFMVDRDQHMRPLEYDLSENFNKLLRYMQDMGVLDNVPVGTTSESEIVSISDAYPAPPRALTVEGASTQVTTTGKNLFNPDQTPHGYYNPTTGAFVENNNYVWWSVPVAEGDVIRWSKSYDCTPSYWNGDELVGHGSQAHYGAYTVATGVDEVRGYCNVSGLSTCIVTKNNANLTYEPYTGGKASPNPDYPQPILSVDNLSVHASADGGTTDYTNWPVSDLLPEGTSLRSLPDGTKDELHLSYLRPSTREGWAWYSRELVHRVFDFTLDNADGTTVRANTPSGYPSFIGVLYPNRTLQPAYHTGNRSKQPIMCTELQSGSHDELFTNSSWLTGITRYPGAGYGIELKLSDMTLTTPALVTAWLSENPLHIIYGTMTPTTETLDPIELPTLPAPNATVWCDGGSATPTLVLEYVRDTNATIADLSEAIADIVSG